MSPSVRRRSPIRGRSPDHLDSPVRGRSPFRRRGSPRKERSSPRHRGSLRPRSPVRTVSSHRTRSPAREKNSVRSKSPQYARSSSSVSRSPSPHSKWSVQAHVERENSKVTKRGRSISPASQSASPRTKRLRRAQADRQVEKVKERSSISRSPSPRTKRLRRNQADRQMEKVKESSPVSQSPSPRTKQLRRAQAEREADKVEREREGNNSRDGDKGRHRDRVLDKEAEKRQLRDKNDIVSSKSRETRHGRSNSPADYGHKSRYSSHSPSRASKTAARDEESRGRGTERRDVDYDDSVSKMKVAEDALEAKEKQKPSFELSGKLAAETNRVRGITLLFNEPPDARKPDIRWRLYVFKSGEVLNEPLYVHRQSCYLFGRERRVADIPTDHPSCSKQHAVIQFRRVEKELPDGMMSKQVRPYVMDLGSTNGTFINDNRIEPQRYYELFEKDTIKFGNSSREYVLLHENSVE